MTDAPVARTNPENSAMIVTISPNYEGAIRKEVRRHFDFKPGQQLWAKAVDGRIELMPQQSARELRGFPKSMDTSVQRQPDRT